MRRQLLRSTAFVRAARRALRNRPQAAPEIRSTLEQLEFDAFQPALRTHKLKGRLTGSWACRVSLDLRIVYRFVEFQGQEAILLETVGTHDEVY